MPNNRRRLAVAKTHPEISRQTTHVIWVLQRPDAFLAFAACDDETLDKLMTEIGQSPKGRKRQQGKTK